MKPPRVRFGKSWKYKPCTNLMKKQKGMRNIGSKNAAQPVLRNKISKVGNRKLSNPSFLTSAKS